MMTSIGPLFRPSSITLIYTRLVSWDSEGVKTRRWRLCRRVYKFPSVLVSGENFVTNLTVSTFTSPRVVSVLFSMKSKYQGIDVKTLCFQRLLYLKISLNRVLKNLRLELDSDQSEKYRVYHTYKYVKLCLYY